MPRRNRPPVPKEIREANRLLGGMIRQARLVRGISLPELSRRTHVASYVLARYERGEVICPALMLVRIAQAIDVSLRDLTRNVPKLHCPQESSPRPEETLLG